MGAVMLLGRGEERTPDVAGLLAPLVILELPAMALSVGFATLFDAVRPLRGPAGGVIFFVVFLAGAAAGGDMGLWGSGVLLSSIAESCAVTYGAACAARPAVDIVATDGTLQLFTWLGMAWSIALVAGQWLWVGAGLLLVLTGAALFDGFGPAREGRRRQPPAPAAAPEEPPQVDRAVGPIGLSPAVRAQASIGRVLLAELRIMVRGRPWWWYAV